MFEIAGRIEQVYSTTLTADQTDTYEYRFQSPEDGKTRAQRSILVHCEMYEKLMNCRLEDSAPCPRAVTGYGRWDIFFEMRIRIHDRFFANRKKTKTRSLWLRIRGHATEESRIFQNARQDAFLPFRFLSPKSTQNKTAN